MDRKQELQCTTKIESSWIIRQIADQKRKLFIVTLSPDIMLSWNAFVFHLLSQDDWNYDAILFSLVLTIPQTDSPFLTVLPHQKKKKKKNRNK